MYDELFVITIFCFNVMPMKPWKELQMSFSIKMK